MQTTQFLAGLGLGTIFGAGVMFLLDQYYLTDADDDHPCGHGGPC